MTITLQDYMKAINYQVTSGSEFEWHCFGENVHQLESADRDDNHATYTACVVFDKSTQVVYELQAWDYLKNCTYRWIAPKFVETYKEEYAVHKLPFDIALDNEKFIDLDVVEDILEKITAIVAGEEYDARVQIPIDFSDAELLLFALEAHKRDITLNQFINDALIEKLKD